MSPRIAYESWRPGTDALYMLDTAQRIANEYAQMGYNLTLRQLYYRFVATDAFPEERRYVWNGRTWVRNESGTPNAEPNYKYLGEILNRGRLAGFIDWNHIEDRTRNLDAPSTWDAPADILEIAKAQYAEDLWATQDYRVEVWVEKDALVDVVSRPAKRWQVPHFSCRGYTSQSEMWRAGRRIAERLVEHRQPTIIIHLGDHDPSGIDMSRDIFDRLFVFVHGEPDMWDLVARADDPNVTRPSHYFSNSGLVYPHTFEVKRLALNMDQIEDYGPPPNPTKLSDSRAAGYIDTFGYESWELDALEPQIIDDLIDDEIRAVVDMRRLEDAIEKQEEARMKIEAAIRGMR